MKAHQEFKNRMTKTVGKTFLSEFFVQEKPWHHPRNGVERQVTYIPYEECPYSIPTEKTDSKGRPTAKTRWIDFVFFIAAGERAAYHGDCFSIGIEMKGNSRDLWRDNKIQKYLGKTDYTFLAVPDYLTKEALMKANHIPGIGVFSLDSGHIIKQPHRQTVTEDSFRQMLFRALFSGKPIHSFLIDKDYAEVPGQSFPLVEEAPSGTSHTNKNTQIFKHQNIMNFVGTRTNETRIPRLEIKNGKLNIWQGADQPAAEFDYAVGHLLSIDTRRKTTANGEMVYCDFRMANNGEQFCISTIASSCVTADLVSRLANLRDPKHSEIRVDVWRNNKYSNVVVRENNTPVPFRKLPRLQKIDRGFKVETDSSERDAEVMRLINEINEKLRANEKLAAS